MSTPVSHIIPGSVVFTEGIAYDPEDLAIGPTKDVQTGSVTGKHKHYGIVLDRDATGITVAGLTTFGGATKLVGTVKWESTPLWIPVAPAGIEEGMSRWQYPVYPMTGDMTTPKWISLRKKYYIPGTEFIVSADRQFSLGEVDRLLRAVHPDIDL
ncbi:hypothetical protein GY45DRAFT_1331036 [Cubamyces sp. BRFM 1775]|nr:hypothetical protein GY45DRAFT_1331036 [Cubamyces sp. BRFM 1775]